MASIIIEAQAVPPFFKNGFLVACEETREAVLIDPGDEVPGLLAFADRESFAIRHILLTHAHVDHLTGVGAAKRALGVPVHLHRDDLFLYEAAVKQGAMFGLSVEAPPPIDLFYTEGEAIAFGRAEARPHHTPGHCPGGVCLQIGRQGSGRDLFVGDTLFAGAIGRTDLPGGNMQKIVFSIRNVLYRLPPKTVVYPGHGPATTIEEEQLLNPFVPAAR